MEELKVYIVNVGKCNENRVIGAWFSCPVNEEEMKERLILGGSYGEYAIYDYSGFSKGVIDEYMSLLELNNITKKYVELYEAFEDMVADMVDVFSVEYLHEQMDNIMIYSGKDMTEVAEEIFNEEYPDIVERLHGFYIDYEAYGRDIMINDSYYETRHGVFRILR